LRNIFWQPKCCLILKIDFSITDFEFSKVPWLPLRDVPKNMIDSWETSDPDDGQHFLSPRGRKYPEWKKYIICNWRKDLDGKDKEARIVEFFGKRRSSGKEIFIRKNSHENLWTYFSRMLSDRRHDREKIRDEGGDCQEEKKDARKNCFWWFMQRAKRWRLKLKRQNKSQNNIFEESAQRREISEKYSLREMLKRKKWTKFWGEKKNLSRRNFWSSHWGRANLIYCFLGSWGW